MSIETVYGPRYSLPRPIESVWLARLVRRLLKKQERGDRLSWRMAVWLLGWVPGLLTGYCRYRLQKQLMDDYLSLFALRTRSDSRDPWQYCLALTLFLSVASAGDGHFLFAQRIQRWDELAIGKMPNCDPPKMPNRVSQYLALCIVSLFELNTERGVSDERLFELEQCLNAAKADICLESYETLFMFLQALSALTLERENVWRIFLESQPKVPCKVYFQGILDLRFILTQYLASRGLAKHKWTLPKSDDFQKCNLPKPPMLIVLLFLSGFIALAAWANGFWVLYIWSGLLAFYPLYRIILNIGYRLFGVFLWFTKPLRYLLFGSAVQKENVKDGMFALCILFSAPFVMLFLHPLGRFVLLILLGVAGFWYWSM